MSDGRARVAVGEKDRVLWTQAAIRIRASQALLALYGDPAASSPLASDDSETPDSPLSDAVRSYLTAALDNLSLWANVVSPLVFIEGVTVEDPPRPHFTLARAGLESAVQAVWVLEPQQSTERIERHLRLAINDLENMRVTAQHVDTNAVAQVADRIVMLRKNQPTEIKKAPNYLSMVRSAAPVVGMTPEDAEFLWRTSSAAAHGKPWFIEATHTTTVGEEFAAGRYRAVRTPDPGTISAVVSFATQVTDRATVRFGQLLGADLNKFVPQSLAVVRNNMPQKITLPSGADQP